MSERADVLIIGGGVVGVCTAYYVAGHGRAVTLVEQGEIASGSSNGNAGFILPSHVVPLASPGALSSGLRWMFDPESPFYIKPRLDLDLFDWLLRFMAASNERHVRRSVPVLRELACASIALYEELSRLDGLDFGYRQNGMMYVYKTRKGLAHGAEEAAFAGEAGTVSKVLNAEEACALEPTVRPDVAGGVYYPEDAHIDPGAFVRGLARRAETQGVCIRTQTEVLNVETTGRRVTRVRTTRGDFHPDQVVLAAGAWSPATVRGLRLRVPIQPAKGYSVTVQRPQASPGMPLLLGESRVAVTPLGDRLRFGGTLELAGLDFTINRQRVEAIMRAANDYLVGMDDPQPVEIWRGLRPCTPDGLPMVGRTKAFENLILAAGHATVGMSLGPITGKLVAQVVNGQTPEMDLTPLRAERF